YRPGGIRDGHRPLAPGLVPRPVAPTFPLFGSLVHGLCTAAPSPGGRVDLPALGGLPSPPVLPYLCQHPFEGPVPAGLSVPSAVLSPVLGGVEAIGRVHAGLVQDKGQFAAAFLQ